MRFLRLRLAPYGPFADLSLDFDPSARLHLVYGPNGAGKSTVLDALRSVLYGLSGGERSFRFDSSGLRLGARLVHSSGEELEYVRRTSTKTPLWSADDTAPLAPERLLPFLGNLDRAQFALLFGLDHETMTAGGEQLLRGEGEIGQALFTARLGGRRLAEVVKHLEEEQKELWAERATKPRINALCAAREEVAKELRRATLTWSAHEQDRRALQRAQADLGATDGELRRLRSEREELERLARALARLAPLEDVRRERGLLGELVPLDADTARSVLHHASERGRARDILAQSEQRLAELAERLSGLRAAARPDLLAAAADVRALGERIGEFQSALSALPAAEAEEAAERLALAAAEERAGGALPRAQPHGTFEDLAAAVQEHADRLERSAEQRESAVREARRAEASLAQARAAAATTESDLAARSARELEALAPFRGTLTELAALPVPARATIDAHDAELEALGAKVEDALRRARDARAEAHAARERLAALCAAPGGPPPTRDEVLAARAARDAALQSALASPPSAAEAVALERAVRAADELADRHGAHREHAAERAQEERRAARCADDAAAHERAAAEHEAERADAERAWNERWTDAGFTPLAPRAMAEWCELRRALLQRVADAREAARTRILDEEAECAKRAADAAVAAEAEEAARERWCAFATAAGLVPDAGTDAARQRLVAWGELGRAATRLTRASASVQRLRELVASFEADVAARCDRLRIRPASEGAASEAPRAGSGEARSGEPRTGAGAGPAGARGASTLAAMERLRAAVEAAQRADSQRDEIERSAAHERELAAATRQQLESHEGALSAATASAGLGSDAECIERAERSERARDLDCRLEELALAFAAEARGRTPEELRAEAAGRSNAELEAAAAERATRIEERDAARMELASEVGRLRARFEGPGSDEGARKRAELAELDAELEDALRALLRVRVARRFLDDEVARHRREAQGPLLARAGALFATLTRGAYTALHPSEEKGRDVLVARRPNGQTVHVAGMSTGTRDELYLALRIATVEHMLTRTEPMPFIADDLFVNFDDERTEAALRALAELGTRTQVIVFSHHLHVVDIARRLTEEGLDVDVLRLAGERERSTAGG